MWTLVDPLTGGWTPLSIFGMRIARILVCAVATVVTATTAAVDPAGGSAPAEQRTVAEPLDDAMPVARAAITVAPARSAAAPTAAELDDLSFIADSEGISQSEAIRRYGWQSAFGAAVDAVEERYPGRFAGSSMQTTDVPSATIELTGEIPPDVAGLITGVPVPVTVTGQAVHSEAEIREAVETAHYAARAEPSTGQVSTEYAEDIGAIVVTLYDGPTSAVRRSGEMASVERSAERAVSVEGGGFPVEVEYGPEGGAGSEAIRGGAIMTFPGTQRLACTSGWPVRSTDSELQGLITAEHCPNDLEYSGRDVLTYRNRVPKSQGDIQAMSSTESVAREYYYGVGKYRKVYEVGRPREDQYLCKFGRTTGRTCDNVRDLTTCRGDYCNLVSMDEHTSDTGDSGGPWGYGDTAYGVHSGAHTSAFRTRSQWTPLYNTLSYMRVGIKVARR